LFELADLHLDLLYERDGEGRILRTRTRDQRATPRYHLTRTTEGNRWLVAAELPGEERSRLEEALSGEPVVASLEEMEERAPGVTIGGIRHSGPGFCFPAEPASIGGAEVVGNDIAGVRTVPELDWIRELTLRERPIAVALSSDGDVVSVCHSARSTERGAEAGLETATQYRGRGLAVAVVAAWAAAVNAEGWLPLYSTEWSNGASRAVARKLGLVMYGEDTIGGGL
jgi:hypothetical protein